MARAADGDHQRGTKEPSRNANLDPNLTPNLNPTLPFAGSAVARALDVTH